MDRWLGWHFLNENGRTGYGNRKPVPGATMHCHGELVLCQNGLHASKRAIDALHYATGSIIQRVELVGERRDESDKSCARSRGCLWIADATRTLHEFALWCGEVALDAEREAGRKPDARSVEVLAVKRRWLDGLATDAELDAARDAAWAAARDAAWDAAWAAALDAARAAAWAARDAQNNELERRLMALAPAGYKEAE